MRVDLVRRRSSGEDSWGDPLPPVVGKVCGCLIAPSSTDDIEGRGRSGAVQGFMVYAPWGVDVRHGDEFELPAPYGAPGEWWQIDGDVGPWASAYTRRKPGVTFKVKRGVG